MPDEPLTAKEVIRFVSRSDVIAPIWIEDIGKLSECQYGASLDTWQIGTVPSRLFRIVGVILHTNSFDNESNWRTVYIVDDGTGCVEINHTEYKKFAKPRLEKQEESRRSAKAKDQLPQHPTPLPPMIPCHVPLANWSIARFTIRVKKGTVARIVELHKVEQLRSVQEEVNHWKQVMRLHETHYRQPFVIPSLPPPPVDVPPPRPRDRATQEAPPTTPRSNPVRPVSPVTVHAEPSTESLVLPHPASIKSADLHFRTFTFYLACFMRHDKLSHTAHQTSPTSPALGFSFDYLRRVPDLRYLARRILLAEARRMTRDYLVKRRALEPTGDNRPLSKADTNLRKPAPLTDDIMTKKVNDLFAHALRRLFGEGDIIAGSGKSRPIPPEMVDLPRCSLKEYPKCLGQFRLWDPPPPLSPAGNVEPDALDPKSRTSGSSSRRSWRIGLQDQDGPVDALERLSSQRESDEDAEVYFVVTPELMGDDVLKAVALLGRRKERGQHGGGSPGDILATLIRLDEKWRKMNEDRVGETLELLSDAKKIWNYMKDQWATIGV